MPVIRFIGDIHTYFDKYEKILTDCPYQSIQVGDFGMGMSPYEPPTDFMVENDHWFIRGNHDNPALCREHPRWIKDGTMHRGVFCLGGARSRDRLTRKVDRDWWPDEELSHEELQEATQRYAEAKPDVVATHDCPDIVLNHMFEDIKVGYTNTGLALTAMFEIHRPKLWLFGHWHRTAVKSLNGTTFMCLGINRYADVLVEEKVPA